MQIILVFYTFGHSVHNTAINRHPFYSYDLLPNLSHLSLSRFWKLLYALHCTPFNKQRISFLLQEYEFHFLPFFFHTKFKPLSTSNLLFTEGYNIVRIITCYFILFYLQLTVIYLNFIFEKPALYCTLTLNQVTHLPANVHST